MRGGAGSTRVPWYLLHAYFHVHTPLFSSRANKGRSQGGVFGDNVEELDDSVGVLLDAVHRSGAANDTLVLVTSDNGERLRHQQVTSYKL